MIKEKFVYTDDELRHRFAYASYAVPSNVFKENDELLIAEYQGFMQEECAPIIRYNDKLYGAGPISIQHGSSPGYCYREYYPYKLPEGVPARVICDMDVNLAKVSCVVDARDENGIASVEVMVSLPGLKPAILNAVRYNHCWSITRVNVPEKYRRLGVGTKMLRRALAEIKRMGFCEIAVAPGGYSEDVSKQIRFYEKSKFRLMDDGMMKYFVHI